MNTQINALSVPAEPCAPVHLSLNIPEGNICVFIKPYEVFSESLKG